MRVERYSVITSFNYISQNPTCLLGDFSAVVFTIRPKSAPPVDIVQEQSWNESLKTSQFIALEPFYISGTLQRQILKEQCKDMHYHYMKKEEVIFIFFL